MLFKDYLKQFKVQKSKDAVITHTRIGDKNSKPIIYGGNYNIPYTDEFWDIYYENIFKNNCSEYLVEKQIYHKGILLVDIDFRYNKEINERQHNIKHIKELINTYLEKIACIYNIHDESVINAYVMERETIYKDKELTKDGIHLVFDILMDREAQIYLRKTIINNIADKFNDLPLINDYNDVFDECITNGTNGWILYGSTKPKCKSYKITHHFKSIYNKDNDDWDIIDKIDELNTREVLPLISARNQTHASYEYNENEYIKEALDYESNELSKKNQHKLKNEDKYEVETKLLERSIINNNNDENDLKNEIYFLLKLLNNTIIDNYNKWFKVISSVINIGRDNDNKDLFKEITQEISKKSDRYTDDGFEKTWNNINGNNNYNIGTLKYYAKSCNENEYKNYYLNNINVYNLIKLDEKIFKHHFLTLHKDDLIAYNGNIYLFDIKKKRWKLTTKNGAIIRNLIEKEGVKLLLFNIKKYTKIFADTENKYNNAVNEKNTDEIKKLEDELNISKFIITNLKEIKRRYGDSIIKNIYNLIINELMCNEFDKENDPFDSDPYLLAFNNIVFNFKTRQFQEHSKDDKLLMNTNKDYMEPTKEEYETIKSIFETTFVDEEIRRGYISILLCGMLGLRENEVFIFANGEGRNGKGLINELFQYLLGEYCCALHLDILTKPLKGGVNEELLSLHKKRVAISQEPSASNSDKLLMSNIKKLTGTSYLPCRGLYEKETIVKIVSTIILECNKLPYIDTDGNNAETARFLNCKFNSIFTDKESDINNITHFPINRTYKLDTFKEKHYSALFKYIIDNCSDNKMYIPSSFTDEGKKYLRDKDEFCNWIDDNFEKQENSIVKISNLYQIYKESDYYKNLKKAEQRQNTKKNFTEMLKRKFGEQFRERYTYYNNKQLKGDCLIDLAFINDNDDDDDDDSDSEE